RATRGTRAVAAAAEVTIELLLTCHGTTEQGPARIASISADASHRNVTLGQSETGLTLRLRTPWSGPNGREHGAEITWPDQFPMHEPTHVALATDGRVIRLYRDGVLVEPVVTLPWRTMELGPLGLLLAGPFGVAMAILAVPGVAGWLSAVCVRRHGWTG